MSNIGLIKCGACKVSIEDTQDSIRCRICCRRLHYTCADVTPEDVSTIEAIRTPMVFICSPCQEDIANNNECGVAAQITELHNRLDSFMESYSAHAAAVKKDLDDIRSNIRSFRDELKAGIVERNKCTNQNSNASTSSKILALETENNAMYRQLNRPDIIISGLPADIVDLVAIVIALGEFYKVPVVSQNINHVCYIHSRKMILVKFNNVHIRDTIMKEYFKTRSLRICDIIKGNGSQLTTRVYLNNHHSPAVGKLNAICRKLLRRHIVMRFRVLNTNKPKAMLTLPNGRVIVQDAAACEALLNGTGC